jgi:hypothetical protein
MRAKILTAGLLAVLLGTTALADTASMNPDVTGMGLLENEWIRAGINLNTGTFGSGGGTSPGLLFDPEGTGTFNPSYDYLTPGSPFDGFSVKVDGTNYANNNTGSTAITKTGEGLGANAITWNGEVTDKFQIDMNYSLVAGQPFVNGIATINMLTDADTLSFGKYIDPDSQGMPGDSSSTDNVLGYGVIPSTNVAFSEATTSRYALGIYTTDTNVTAGVESWTQEADGYEGTNYTDAEGNPVNYGNSDDTIGISWTWTGVTTGDMLEASYAYIFGPSAFDAAEDAITGGAGGGDTTTTDGWGTLEDVGSATDAAEADAGGADPVITTETVVDTSRPVLTASITTHESSVADGVQTIDREKTTTTTTPMKTVTYTDGVETSSAVADSVITSAVTDPGAFVGRMDAATQLTGLNVHRSLTIPEGITGGRVSHDMGNGYSAETKSVGIGHTAGADNGMLVSGGLNRAETTMTGTDSSGSMTTTVLQGRVGKALDDRDATISVGGHLSNSDISYSRTIGDFSAQGETTARDVGINVTAEKSTGKVRPFAGVTIGKKTVDAYDETGDVQAVLSHAATDEMYRYATLGLNVDTGVLTASVSKDFGDSDAIRIGLGIDRAINERISIGASANRLMDGDNTSTYMSAGIKIRF